jgi:SAM-dependent methyltransferase
MSQVPLYSSRWAGAGYDALARFVFAPVGGLARLRSAALDAAELPPHARVLELGCGSGGFTRLLLARGSQVTSVDRAPSMLARARRRAAEATFVESELTVYEPAPGAFDVAWCAFVLHELSAEARQAALAVAHTALAPTGKLVIVEHALPSAGWVPRAMSRLVHAFEPRSLRAWLRGGFELELLEAGFEITGRRELARDTAVVLVCAPR